MNIQILDDAADDLNVGWSFYERQEQGIGDYFWDTLLSDIESLIIYAGVHTKKYGYYRMTSKRFPYSIYYDIKGETAYIVAVLPERRSLDWIRENIKAH